MSVRCLAVFAALVLAALLLPTLAFANPVVYIDDLTERVTVTHDPDFLIFMSLENPPYSEHFTFWGFFYAAEDKGADSGQSYLFEYIDPVVSDYLSVTWESSLLELPTGAVWKVDITGTFISLAEHETMEYNPQIPGMLETGGYDNMTGLMDPLPPFAVLVKSDPENVPEPAAFGLLGLALLGLHARKRR